MSIPTVTLETARRLKELGMPQDWPRDRWAFYWCVFPSGTSHLWALQMVEDLWADQPDGTEWFAAYTAGELMEWFDVMIILENDFESGRKIYRATYDPEVPIVMIHDNVAEALGLLAVQILESQTTEAT